MSEEHLDTLRISGFDVVECKSFADAFDCLASDSAKNAVSHQPRAWVYGNRVLINDTLSGLTGRISSQKVIHIYRPDEPEVLVTDRKEASKAMEVAELRWKLADTRRLVEELTDAYCNAEDLATEIKLKDLHISQLAAELLDVSQREEQLNENGGYVHHQWSYARRLLNEVNEEKYELQAQLIDAERKMRMLMGGPLKRFRDLEKSPVASDSP